MARSYADTLAHLVRLQSNVAISSRIAASPGLNGRALPEMRTWLHRAGILPDNLARLRCLHVSGTKGKGSVCAYATQILRQHAATAERPFRVGTYTSPHLVSVRERIALDGQPISQEAFTHYFFTVWDALESSVRSERAAAAMPNYFRFLTIMALRVFLDEGVHSAVMECGIGGQYDATNVLPAAAVSVAVVTQLGLDHVSMLGGTREQIAWHKAGIFKRGVLALTRRLGDDDGDADGLLVAQVLRRRASELGADLIELSDDDVRAWKGAVTDGHLRGSFQRYNQALAAVAVQEHLRLPYNRAHPLLSIPPSFFHAMRRTRLRGRTEILEDGTDVWFLDGAHTAESLDGVAEWFVSECIARIAPPVAPILIFNQQGQDRDVTSLLERLLRTLKGAGACSNLVFLFHHAVFSRNEPDIPQEQEPPRDLATQQAAAAAMREAQPACNVCVVDSAKTAVSAARDLAVNERRAGRRPVILVTGSLHLVGGVLQTLEPNSPS